MDLGTKDGELREKMVWDQLMEPPISGFLYKREKSLSYSCHYQRVKALPTC